MVREVALSLSQIGFFYSKAELVRYFLQCLQLQADDVVILDRETGIGQVVFEESQKAKLGVVVHAEHFK